METKNATDQNFNLLFLRNEFLSILEDFIVGNFELRLYYLKFEIPTAQSRIELIFI